MKLKLTLIIFLSFVVVHAQNALDFDGVDDYVQTTAPGISGTAARTIEAWIKTDKNYNPSSGGTQGVVVDMGTMTVGQRFTLNLLWNNAIRVEIGGHGISGTTPVNDGNWHHIAAVYDPTQATKVFLYIDGQLETSGNFASSVVMNTNPGSIVLGRRIDNINHFEGVIDEVRIWNTARTASQIAGSLNNEFCASASGLVAYYKLNDGMAGGANTGLTTTPDFVSGNDGTLHNFALSGNASNWISGNSLTSGATQDSISITECFSYATPSGLILNSSGNYIDTITSAFGCDSVLYIDLTINSIDTVLNINNQTLSTAQAGSNFQWLDCENNYAPIPGQTAQSMTVSSNGSYALQIVSNGCLDTTQCITIDDIGIWEGNEAKLIIYPNPTHGDVFIGGLEGEFEYRILDVYGRVVMKGLMRESKVDIESLSTGNYIIQIQTADHLHNYAITKS